MKWEPEIQLKFPYLDNFTDSSKFYGDNIAREVFNLQKVKVKVPGK